MELVLLYPGKHSSEMERAKNTRLKNPGFSALSGKQEELGREVLDGVLLERPDFGEPSLLTIVSRLLIILKTRVEARER